MERRRILPPTSASAAAPAVLIGVLVLALLPFGLEAQSSSDFLFGSPTVTLGVYGGYDVPGAESDVFDFTTDDLTADRSDYRSLALGGRLGIRVSERLDVALDVAHAMSETDTEYREWVDQDDRPIEQTTSFSRTPVTVNLKFHPWERGRTIGRFVWIPRSVSPYAGAGVGLTWYDFRMSGDFVEYATQEIFRSTLDSDGRALTGQAFAGLDVSLGPRFLLNWEVRGVWASADLDSDFRDFEPIDLSGYRSTVGIAVRL